MASSLDKKTCKLAWYIINFVHNTLKGQESGMYKTVMSGHIPNFTLADLSTPLPLVILRGAIIDYLNSCYKSLILKDSEYVSYHFKKMKKSYNHSEICLLNIIALVIQNIHLAIDRSKFDVCHIETYLASFDAEFIKAVPPMLILLISTLSHECTGMNIAECDPNKPMFH